MRRETDFEVVDEEYAEQLREKFIKRFVDTECEYFQRYYTQTDGNVHGFLWDCLNTGDKKRCTQKQAAEELFVVRDIHSRV